MIIFEKRRKPFVKINCLPCGVRSQFEFSRVSTPTYFEYTKVFDSPRCLIHLDLKPIITMHNMETLTHPQKKRKVRVDPEFKSTIKNVFFKIFSWPSLVENIFLPFVIIHNHFSRVYNKPRPKITNSLIDIINEKSF